MKKGKQKDDAKKKNTQTEFVSSIQHSAYLFQIQSLRFLYHFHWINCNKRGPFEKGAFLKTILTKHFFCWYVFFVFIYINISLFHLYFDDYYYCPFLFIFSCIEAIRYRLLYYISAIEMLVCQWIDISFASSSDNCNLAKSFLTENCEWDLPHMHIHTHTHIIRMCNWI